MDICTLKCKHCNQKLLTYNKDGFKKYDSLVKVCKKCGTRYIDPKCYEIAIQGIPYETYSISSHVLLTVFGAYILYRGLYLLGTYQLEAPEEMQWLYPAMFITLGSILLLLGSVGIISIKSGRKAKKFDKLKKESEKRLNDKSYVYVLQDFGYQIPKKYL